MERAYVLFITGGLYFLVPLEQVVSVESLATARKMEIPVYDLGQACHLSEKPVEIPYILVLSPDEEKMGVAVEQVEEVRKICDTELYKLEAPAMGKYNYYLDSVAALEGLNPPLAYLLDTRCLLEKLAGGSEAILE